MTKLEYMTQNGLEKLHNEIEKLESIERRKISIQIAEARDKGDLSENAEYEAAKEAQAFLEIKIAKMKERLSNARIIDSSQLDKSKVAILSTVKVENIKYEKQHIYTLVPEGETDIKYGKISINTPISIGLLGKHVGDIADIKLPNGSILKFKILEINFY